MKIAYHVSVIQEAPNAVQHLIAPQRMAVDKLLVIGAAPVAELQSVCMACGVTGISIASGNDPVALVRSNKVDVYFDTDAPTVQRANTFCLAFLMWTHDSKQSRSFRAADKKKKIKGRKRAPLFVTNPDDLGTVLTDDPNGTNKSATHSAKTAPQTKRDELRIALAGTSAAAIAKVMHDTIASGYGGANAVTTSTALAPVLDGLDDWAQNLVGWCADNNWDAGDKADQLSQFLFATGSNASDLDDMTQQGATQFRFVPEPSCCENCSNSAGTYDVDDLDHLPPVHPGCGCDIAEVQQSQQRSERRSGLGAHVRRWKETG